MSKLSDSIHNSMRDKAKRLTTGEPHAKVDSSTWTPPEMENASVKTGLRPLSKRQYKSGGKVHGADAKKRGDRMARKSEGRTEKEDRAKRYLTPDNLLNRDVRMANEAREGIKHVGGFKKGGRAHHMDGKRIPMPTPRPKYLSDSDYANDPAFKSIQDAKAIMAQKEQEAARAAAFDAEQQEAARKRALLTGGMKRGGEAKHTDEAQDKKLMHEVLREKAFKAAGGGLYANIHAKQERIAHGSKEHMRKPGSKGAPTSDAFKQSAKTAKPYMATGGKTMHHDDCSCKMCMGGRAKKAEGGQTEAQRVGAALSKFYKEGRKPAVQSTKSPDFDEMRKVGRNLTTAEENQGYKKGGRSKHANGGKIFSGNSMTKIPGEVPGGRSAHKHGGKAKGKTHININVMPHPAGGAPMAPPMGGPMGGPPMPPPAPPMAPPRPPMGGPQGAPPVDPAMLAMLMKGGGMGGGMGGGRPPMAPPMGGGMPMGRKHGGRAMAKTDHVINHAAGGGLGRLEKIKAYGEPQKHMK